MSARILVVEDDPRVRAVLERGLAMAGHEITLTEDLAGGRAAWAESTFDLVLLDVMLPDGDGIALLAERRDAGDETPTVLLTAREESELHQRAVAAGATDYLAKPFAYADLLARVERLTTGH
ncbi:MAG: response regulator transcription factor [Candidatus Limnocylindria bacterium]